MPFDLHLAPFLPQLAVSVDQESASLNAHKFSSIKHLFADDIELSAKRLVRIGQQVKRKCLLYPEFFMGSKAIAGCAKNDRFLAPELRMQVAKILSFGRAAGRGVLGIEIQYDLLAT